MNRRNTLMYICLGDRSREIEKLLPSLDFDLMHKDVSVKRVGKTGEWLLNCDEFLQWVGAPNHRILWCPGMRELYI